MAESNVRCDCRPIREMADSRSGCIKMAAVGRRLRLGQFYDYRTDTAFADALDGERLRMATRISNSSKLKVYQHSFEEWSSKLAHLGLCRHLQASVVAGLIDKYRGASSYIVDECDLCEALKTLQVRYKQRAEAIDLEDFDFTGDHLDVRLPKDATHVIVAIRYGVESFSLFSSPVGGDESKEDVEEDMGRILNQLSYALKDDLEEFDLRNQLDDVREQVDRVKCKHYADLEFCAREGKLFDAFKWIRKLLSTVQAQGDQTVPLTVTLCPLEHLFPDRSFPLYVDIADDLLERCRSVFDSLSRQRSRVQAMLKSDDVKMFQDFRNSLRQLVECSAKFKGMFHAALKRAVPESRTPSDEQDDAVERAIETATSNVFHHDGMADWLAQKESEMKVLQTLSQMKGVSLILNQSKLDGELFNLEKKFTLVLKLPSLSQKDPLLMAMKSYVENNKRLVASQPESASAGQSSWYKSSGAREELAKVLRQFMDHIEVNGRAEHLSFLATPLLSGADSRPSFALYQNGAAQDFQLPAPPFDVRLVERTKSHITVEWKSGALDVVVKFVVQYKQKCDSKWSEFETAGNETRAKIAATNLSGEICLQVAAVTNGGRSEFSSNSDIDLPPTPKICDPPSLTLCRATHDAIDVKWAEPKHDPDVKISSYRIIYHPEKNPSVVKHVDVTGKDWCRLPRLNSNCKYVVRISADCGADGKSLPSRPFSFVTTTAKAPPVRFALTVQSKCSSLGNVSGLELLLVPLKEEIQYRGSWNGQNIATRYSFGTKAAGQRQHRTILLMGATGSGKTTLINSMINYIFGVQWNDPFRFKLIHEQGASQAHSQTNCVTAYDIHWHQGMNIPYSLTIVDTPGYGDTKGLSRDKQITDIIGKFFQDPNGIQELDAVGFVSQASLPRLTPTQVYIFDSVLSIFGNDIKDNINLLLTFADNQLPPVLSAIVEAGIPCSKGSSGQPLHHKFNNSGFFASRAKASDPITDKFNTHFWAMGMENFGKFFAELNKMKTKSLTLTQQVLDERKQLETTVEGLQPLIQRGLVRMEEVRKTKEAIDSNQAQIDANVNLEIEVEVTEAQKVDISHTGHFLTNCSKCHVTCHYPCAYQRDDDKKRCSAMTDGVCRICPEKCIWNIHFNQPYRWQYVTVKKRQSSSQVKDKYEKLQKRKLSAEGLINVLEKELEDIETRVLQSVTTVAESIQRLEEIALRPNPFSTPQYIDLMINSELQEKRPGFKERIQSLRQLRQLAEVTHKIRTRQSVLPGVDSSTLNLNATRPSVPRRRSSNGPGNVSVQDERFRKLFG